MIYKDCTITINKGVATISEPIILYRGDKEVELCFEIKENLYKYSDGTNIVSSSEASYSQIVIKVPNNKPPIFGEILETKEGKAVLKVTSEMIDEIDEVGFYDFQVRLFDKSKTSRITIPPVEKGIEIREPIAIEDESTTNEVGIAKVGYAQVGTKGVQRPTLNEDGSYNRKFWIDKEPITKEDLNVLEDIVDKNTTQVKESATKKYVDEQCKDIAKDVLLEDGKLYLKKSDGTKLGTGVILPISGSGGSVVWESITGKPTAFTPSSHSHSKSDITDFPTIPTKTSQLTNDSGFLTSHQDISGKVDKEEGKGLSTNDLTNALRTNYDNAYAHSQTSHAPSDAKPNVQSDWNENNVSSDAYIKNKPTIPSAYVLPTASATVLGGVKVGAGLSISNGVLSATGGAGGSSINDTTVSATTTYSSNKIETIKEGLNSQIEQKANQSDLEVERERINSFTTLSSGSTTGDAELIDGRIGADGVTYTNIGTAIRTQCGNLNNLLDIGYEVTSNNRIDDSKFVGKNFDTLIGHNGNESKTFTLGAKLKSKTVKGYIEFEDGTYADPLNGFFWFLKSSTGEVSNVTLSTKGTLVIADAFDKYDQIGIGSWTTYDKKIKTFFVGAYADDYDNYNEVLTSKVIDDIKISTPDNWYRDKKICAYGDSLVEQEKWQPYVASYLKCSFYNRGVGGTTVTQVNSSTNHMSGDMRINSIPTDSDVILIFAGHNDWSYAAINMGDLKTDALSESTSFKAAYGLMLKKIQARCPNAKIITMTLVGGRTTSETVNEDKQFYIRELCMTDFSKAIKEVSGYYGIPCIDVNANSGINTLNHTTYIADLIHVNLEGGKLLANEVVNGLKRFEPIVF